MQNAIDFLGAIEFRIIEMLVDNSLYIREIAEKLCIAPSTAFRAVKKLAEQGIVVFTAQKNKKIVSLNRESVLAGQIVAFLFVFKIINSKAFAELKKQALSIGLYGSAAEGNLDKLSDIDLWVLSEKKIGLEKLGGIRALLGKELEREVSIRAFTKESLEKLKQSDKIFFDEIRYKSKILHGEGIEQS